MGSTVDSRSDARQQVLKHAIELEALLARLPLAMRRDERNAALEQERQKNTANAFR